MMPVGLLHSFCWGCGEFHYDLQSLFRVLGFDGPVMPLDDLLGDGKAQTRSSCPRLLGTIEGFEDLGQIPFGKCFESVGDADDKPVLFGMRPYNYLAPFGCELDGIIKDI